MNSQTASVQRSIGPAYGIWCFVFLLTACNNTADPVSTQAIAELTGPSTAVTVGQGLTTKSLVSIKRASTFNGVVQLTAENLPQGMVVSFAPSALSSTATLSEMTINAFAPLAPGPHTFTVRASAELAESRTVTVSVMVTVPAFTLAAATTTASIAQGSSQAIPISIAREGGFTGLVGLVALGLPTGVTATFSPQSIESGATTSTLTLSAPLTAQPSVSTITLRATAQGVAEEHSNKTIPIVVNVVPATTPAVLVSANPVFLQVDGGQSIETTLTLQRFAGFNGAVNVSVDGLPSTLSAITVPFAAGSNTTTLRISASEQEPGGGYQLTVRATGTGIQAASTGLAVQARQMPHFDLFFEPTSPTSGLLVSLPLAINRGANATPRLTIGRVTQYSLPVSLTISGVPAGVTTNLPATMQSSTASQSFQLAINVSAVAVPGVYTMTIRGETATPLTREVTIILTVN